MIDPAIVDLATTVLTDKQLQVWQLHTQRNMSFRAIAVHLDLGRTTVTDRYDNACRTLRKHGIMVTPDGRPYLQRETA